MPTFCEPHLMVQRRGPGKLEDWLTYVVGIGCFVTFIAVMLGVQLVCDQLERAVDVSWFRSGVTFAVAFWILASWLPPARLSRSLRVAVLLPGAHALVIALAWPAWLSISRFVADEGAATELVTAFPIARIAAVTILCFLVFSLLVARRRSGEWLHGFVMVALAELLLLGLWLPISCAAWPGGTDEWWSAHQPLLADLGSRVAFTIVPPTVLALSFTTVALRRPGWLLAYRSLIAQVVLVVLCIAVITRMGASARVMVLYSNLVPILLAAAIVAIAALIGFGAMIWLTSRAKRRRFLAAERVDGVIVADGDDPAIGLEITSWLRGPRLVQRPFAVSTARGTIPVSGAHLVAAIPAVTTQLRTGECVAVLRPGDHVTIAGHGEAGGDPFRTSAAPLAGEILVAPAEAPRDGFTHVALAMWRPCLAYLMIVTAIAIPGLAALAAAE